MLSLHSNLADFSMICWSFSFRGPPCTRQHDKCSITNISVKADRSRQFLSRWIHIFAVYGTKLWAYWWSRIIYNSDTVPKHILFLIRFRGAEQIISLYGQLCIYYYGTTEMTLRCTTDGATLQGGPQKVNQYQESSLNRIKTRQWGPIFHQFWALNMHMNNIS